MYYKVEWRSIPSDRFRSFLAAGEIEMEREQVSVIFGYR